MATVTQQRVQADHLYGLSVLDLLTGLYHRRYGETRLKEALTHAAATGDAFHLVALDFDHFKVINDQHGHAVGDMALKEFARRLRQANPSRQRRVPCSPPGLSPQSSGRNSLEVDQIRTFFRKSDDRRLMLEWPGTVPGARHP